MCFSPRCWLCCSQLALLGRGGVAALTRPPFGSSLCLFARRLIRDFDPPLYRPSGPSGLRTLLKPTTPTDTKTGTHPPTHLTHLNTRELTPRSLDQILALSEPHRQAPQLHIRPGAVNRRRPLRRPFQLHSRRQPEAPITPTASPVHTWALLPTFPEPTHRHLPMKM